MGVIKKKEKQGRPFHISTYCLADTDICSERREHCVLFFL